MKKKLLKEKQILDILSEIYLLFLIVIFPIMVDSTGFFHIFEYKWNVYTAVTSIYLLLNILIIIYYLIFKKCNILKNLNISLIHKLAFIFLLINYISYLFSPFFNNYDLLTGVGRREGLITISLYVFTFLFVSLFGKFKRRYITYFAISAFLLNTIAFLQYIGFNPFNMYQDGIGTHNVSFMITIGNVDFISSLYCILLGVSFGTLMFIDDLKPYEKILHLLSIFFGMFIMGIIDVLSGKVAIIAMIIILFPFLVSSNKRLSNFLVIIAAVLLAYCFNVFINPEYHYDLGRLDLYFQFNYIIVLFLIVSFALLYLARILRNVKYDFSNNKSIIKKMYLGIICCGIVGMIIIYFVSFKNGFLREIHEIMHGNFDDKFGTYRIFLWKRTLAIFPDYPLFGTGPDTFAIRFMARFTNDIAAIGPLTINDTAANVYLTMLINIGVIGLLSYLSFIASQIKEGIKKINSNSAVFLIAIVCFLIQDFFNLWIVIVTPIFWILMAIHYLCLKDKL